MDGRGEEQGGAYGGHLPGLPGVPDDGEDRIVCHVDMDCFYASCERRRECELEGEPVVVGMGYEPGADHGAVATASYEAREFGVESAQAISVALSRLPNREETNFDDPMVDVSPTETGFYRPVDIEYYRSVAEEVREVLRESADTMREVSIDEAYLDVTDHTSWETVGNTSVDGDDDDADSSGDESSEARTLAAGFARHLKERIADEVGVVASVGVAPNMSAAKVASDVDKPDGLVVVPPGTVRDFLAPLSIEDVHGVGPVRARALREMGIETAGDLAAADPQDLVDRFGERGRDLYDRARGDDDRPVTPKGKPKSLNRESAFPEATAEGERHRETVRDLAREVADRAVGEGALYRTIGIKVVTPPFEVSTRARSLSGPVRDGDLLERVALDLLDEFDGATIRKVGVRVSNLDFAAAEQSSLGGWDGASTTDTGPGADIGLGAVDDGSEDEDETGTVADGASDTGFEGSGQASLGDFDR